MIRDLLVPLQRTGSDAAALDAAAALAAHHRAHVAVLAVVANPIPIATEWGLAPAALGQFDYEQAHQAAREQADAALARLSPSGVPCERRVVDAVLGWPEDTAALHARHADLSVYGGPDPDARGPRFQLGFTALLMHSGRPVLVVPHGSAMGAPVRKAVLAWQPCTEATRALHDALPLLAPIAQVDVLVVDPVVAEQGHGEQPGADIARHLARHGHQARVVALPRQGHGTGEVILDYAHQNGAELLVMGGYSHSRWRQQVLGGATRTVLESAAVPVLFSH